MATKKLEVGDRLFSEGSWSDWIITIQSVTETEAIGEDGRVRFPRVFTEGNGYLDMQSTLDHTSWYLIK